MSETGLVLVVDDENFNRILLSTHLREVGYDVVVAESGEKALEILHSQTIDAVLLDLIMPGIDGYAVLKHMQDHETLRNIPVIIISNLKDSETLVQCIELGATDHLPKPFKSVLLKARLDRSLARKRLHDAERAYTQTLEERNQELDAFASTVAHDLKTPLSGILGFTNLLLDNYDGLSEPQRKEMLNNVQNSGDRMNNIIHELLMLARIRKEDVKPVPVDMANILEEVQGRLGYMIQEYEPTLVFPKKWAVALGYAPWVEEVWVNYLTNGLKYGGTPPRLEFGCTLQDDGMVRFWVKDNGAGISVEDQANLFVPFTRLQQARAEGQGLGLSIVQRIVQKLGGEVGVESEVGVGSTFWFSLPLYLQNKEVQLTDTREHCNGFVQQRLKNKSY